MRFLCFFFLFEWYFVSFVAIVVILSTGNDDFSLARVQGGHS